MAKLYWRYKKNGKWTWTPFRGAKGMNHETFLRLVLSPRDDDAMLCERGPPGATQEEE